MKAVLERQLLRWSCHRFCDSTHRAFCEAATSNSESQPPKIWNPDLLNSIQTVDTFRKLSRPVSSQPRVNTASASSSHLADTETQDRLDDTRYGARKPIEPGSPRWTGVGRHGRGSTISKAPMRIGQTFVRDHTIRQKVNWEISDQGGTKNHAGIRGQKFEGELWREEFKPYGKPLSDHICARLFATKVFSPITIIRGLEMLSMTTIGPLALRQLASREQSASGTAMRISQLRDAGITIGKSRFSRLIHRLATTGRDTALLELLDSDLHPDSIEDEDILEKLLVSYHSTGAWSEFRKTLVILTALDLNPQGAIFEKLSKLDLLGTKTFEDTLQQVEELRSAHLQVPSSIFTALVQQAWDRELIWQHEGKAKDHARLASNSLTLAVRSLLQSLHSGQQVTPLLWRTILLRLGCCGKLDEVASLTTELVEWYCKGSQRSQDQPLLSARQSLDSLSTSTSSFSDFQEETNSIFNTQLLADIIQRPYLAYFLRQTSPSRSRAASNGSKEQVDASQIWTSGIRLARKVSDSGVQRVENVVQSACQELLFGTSSVEDNHIIYRETSFLRRRHEISEKQIIRARINNNLPMEGIVAEINRAWGQTIFQIDSDSSNPRPIQRLKPPIRMIR